MTRTFAFAAVSALALAACESAGLAGGDANLTATAAAEDTGAANAVETVEAAADDAMDTIEDAGDAVEDAMTGADMDEPAAARLARVLDAQPDEVKARYVHRRPAATLDFFGVKPGMTVVEALPGGGWYTKILMQYVGPDGTVVGAHYPDDIWARFGRFDEEGVQNRIEATAKWPETAAEWNVPNAADVDSVIVTDMPERLNGQADAVLFIRALHNLNRFDDEAGYMAETAAGAFRVLKPGGVVGVVQHRAPEANPDEWATGAAGYLKQSAVVKAFTDAGFVLEASSDLNANAKDQPTTDDIVWRLPPSFATTEEGTPERVAMAEIGESNRMTLRFRKPA